MKKLNRKTKESIASTILAIITVLCLLLIAGAYKVRSSESLLVGLSFSSGYAGVTTATPTSVTAPSAPPETIVRVVMDHAQLAELAGERLSLDRSPSSPSPSSVTLSGSTGAEASSITARASERTLIPRTRVGQEIAINSVNEATLPHHRNHLANQTKPSPRIPARTEKEAPEVALSEKEEEPSQEMPVAASVIDWMMLQPAPLPPGIERHVGFRSGDLTSVASLEHNGAHYELFLMAKMAFKELHVVLVQGDASFYLIDRSFQREGRSFRSGSVRRNEGTITGLVSEERAAGSAEGAHFYRVFLNWWDRERLTLE